MYLPSKFSCKDDAAIFSLIDKNPLATMISIYEGSAVVSHVPLIREGGNLVGHFAKANPHWKFLEGGPVTVIFHGPQSYITPNWYTKNDVPTWNYAVVHVQGVCRLNKDYDGILEGLKKLSKKIESNSKNPWEFWIPDDLSSVESLTNAIVGFEVEIKDIHAKFKLSQNRSIDDQRSIIHGLESEREDEGSLSVAKMMKVNLPNK